MYHVLETAEVYTVRWSGNPMERNHLKDLRVDGGIILKYVFKKWDGEAWTDLAQDRKRWRAFVTAVMNLRVS